MVLNRHMRRGLAAAAGLTLASAPALALPARPALILPPALSAKAETAGHRLGIRDYELAMLMMAKMMPGVGAQGGGAAGSTNAANFGGVGYLSKGSAVTGLSGQNYTISTWFRKGVNGTTLQLFGSGGNTCQAQILSTNRLFLRFYNSGFSASLGFNDTSAATITDTNWHHLAVSMSTGLGAGSKLLHVYLDGSVYTTTYIDGDGAFTPSMGSAFYIGADSGGGNIFNADLAEFYFAAEYVDITVSANLQKFRTAGGAPANLGADGSTPTGTAPAIYLKTAASFGTNSGTGGNFTINGTIGPAATSPP